VWAPDVSRGDSNHLDARWNDHLPVLPAVEGVTRGSRDDGVSSGGTLRGPHTHHTGHAVDVADLPHAEVATWVKGLPGDRYCNPRTFRLEGYVSMTRWTERCGCCGHCAGLTRSRRFSRYQLIVHRVLSIGGRQANAVLLRPEW
jgi:hypothetical protein